MKRRDFLKAGAGSLITAPFILNRSYAFTGLSASPVFSVQDNQATLLDFTPKASTTESGDYIDRVNRFQIDYPRVASMVDEAVMEFTGQFVVANAWESLFPEGKLNANTRIGIKINFSYGYGDPVNDWNKTCSPFGAKAAVTEAITTGLTQMLQGTFPVENITIYDLAHAITPGRISPVVQGYRPVVADENDLYVSSGAGMPKLHWINSRVKTEFPDDAPGFIAAPDYPSEYQAPQKIAPDVYENDFMINVAVAKDHRSAGITGVMKNTYGCTDNCYATHGDEWKNPDTPFAGTRTCGATFYKNIDKHSPCVLNVLDALGGLYDGGPLAGRVFSKNLIAVSKDPVAIDTYLLKLINSARIKNDYAALSKKDGRADDGHPNASFLRIAEEEHNLGSSSLNKMIQSGGFSQKINPVLPAFDNPQSRIGNAVKFADGFRMNVFMDKSGRDHKIESHIQNEKGAIVREIGPTRTQYSKAELEWDMRNNEKQIREKGLYSWFVNVDGIVHTRTIEMV